MKKAILDNLILFDEMLPISTGNYHPEAAETKPV